MKQLKTTVLLFLLLAANNIAAAKESKSSDNTERPILFRGSRPSTNHPTGDATDAIIGYIVDGAYIRLDLTETCGTARVKCTDLMTGDNSTYTAPATGTSYQYIGDVSGPVQITVTTQDGTYEGTTFVE